MLTKNNKINTNGIDELMRLADETCPINPIIKYKNRLINKLKKVISIFLFSLYYWICLSKKDRQTLKKGDGVRIATFAYFVKETVIQDVHFEKRKP